MPNRTIHVIILAIMLVAAGDAAAGLKILEGEHMVIYDIVNPRGVAFIPDYSNEAFTEKVIAQDEFSKRVQVIAKMHPMKTRVPFPVPSSSISAAYLQYLQPERDRQSNDPPLQQLARELTPSSA